MFGSVKWHDYWKFVRAGSSVALILPILLLAVVAQVSTAHGIVVELRCGDPRGSTFAMVKALSSWYGRGSIPVRWSLHVSTLVSDSRFD